MLLSDITFPIYRIRAHLGIREDSKITYITNMSNEELILDNKNLFGDTIGRRRLRIAKKDRYPLYFTISDIATLVKYPNHTFVDDTGKVFKYQKGRIRGSIYYKPITDVIHRYEDYPLIWVEGIDYPFKVGNYKNLEELYVGILQYRGGHLVYDMSLDKKPSRGIYI